MRKVLKRMFVCVIAIAIIFSLFDFSYVVVNAVEEHGSVISSGSHGSNVQWKYYEDKTLIISGTGAMRDDRISTAGQYNTNRRRWNSYEHEIKNVIIEEGVTTVGDFAFYYCENLESVKLPDTITYIGSDAFHFCSKLKSLNIPNSVKTIEQYAFGRTAVSSFEIPTGVKVVRWNTFYYNTKLKSIILPDTVTEIGSYAFVDCTNLKDVYYRGTEEQWNAIKISSYNTCLTQANIHYNYSGEIIEMFPDGYDFDTDRWGFGNQTIEISKAQYQEAFGKIKGAALYAGDDITAGNKKPGENGQCYGMAASTGVFLADYLPVSSIIPSPDSEPDVLANYLTNAKNGGVFLEDSYIIPFEMNLSYFISYGQLTQKASSMSKQNKNNKNNLQSLYDSIKSYINGTGDPVVIAVRGEYKSKNSGHGVLAVGILSENDEKAVIALNDSNHPDNQRELVLYKDINTGKFIEWEFEFTEGAVWGSGKNYAEISYSKPSALLYNVGLTRNEMVASNTENINAFIENDEKLIVLNSEDDTVLSSIDDDYLYYINCIESNGSDSSEQVIACWYDDTNAESTEFITESKPVSIQMCDDFSSIKVDLPENSTANLVVDDDRDNSMIISTESFENMEFSFSSVSDENEIITLSFSGTADSEEITATETENGIILTGVESGTVTLTVDEEIVKTETFDNARGDVEVKYDKNNAETEVEIDYISYLRLLDATASSDDGEIVITANKDAKKTGIYPTTLSGEKVSLVTENTPIKVSSSGTYYINFADWHKAGNQAKTTMTIGEKQYPVKFVFPIEEDGHDYIPVITEPDCTEAGYTTYTCSACGDEYVADGVGAIGHTEGEAVFENIVAPTCTEEGYCDVVVYCSACDEELSREYASMDVVSHDFEMIVTPPTFTEQGYTTYTCKFCGYNYIDDYTAPIPAGTVTSFGDESDVVTITLTIKGETEPAYITTAPTGQNVYYSFGFVESGEYTMTVSKPHHITRTYDITVNDNAVTTAVQINLLGDLNGDGKLNTVDVARANSHAKAVSTLTDYNFACADVTGDGKVNTIDVARMNSHAKGVNKLW